MSGSSWRGAGTFWPIQRELESFESDLHNRSVQTLSHVGLHRNHIDEWLVASMSHLSSKKPRESGTSQHSPSLLLVKSYWRASRRELYWTLKAYPVPMLQNIAKDLLSLLILLTACISLRRNIWPGRKIKHKSSSYWDYRALDRRVTKCHIFSFCVLPNNCASN